MDIITTTPILMHACSLMIEVLSLDRNELQGTIPTDLGNLPKLGRFLDQDKNNSICLFFYGKWLTLLDS